MWWYMTSPIFAEEPERMFPRERPGRHACVDGGTDADMGVVARFISPPLYAEDGHATVASIVAKKRAERESTPPAPEAASSSSETAEPQPVTDQEAQEAGEEAQGAFNPETGEINWDCPCLGGMADGPCGEEFKTAFSCFVFSTSEPKGMDCIDKFQ